jgi:cytochrome c-type protein NapB
MKSITLTALVTAALILTGAAASKKNDKGIPDSKISLSKVSVFDTPAPEKVKPNDSEPGDRPVIPAPFPDYPPSVPHGIVEFLPITFDDNQCIDCHDVEEKEEGEPTPIPRSHYVDLRDAPDSEQEQLVGARYNCASCHVSPGANALLIGNSFSK